MRGGTLRNALVVGAVVVVVAFVAWRRGAGDPASGDPASGDPASGDPTSGDTATMAETGRGLPRLVDIGAGTCKACQAMAPILDEVKTEFDGRAIVEVIDLREDRDASSTYGVRLIPTQIFYDGDGQEVWRHEGFLPKDRIVAKLEELAATAAAPGRAEPEK